MSTPEQSPELRAALTLAESHAWFTSEECFAALDVLEHGAPNSADDVCAIHEEVNRILAQAVRDLQGANAQLKIRADAMGKWAEQAGAADAKLIRAEAEAAQLREELATSRKFWEDSCRDALKDKDRVIASAEAALARQTELCAAKETEGET